MIGLRTGTDVNTTDFRGVTPLHLALSRLKILGEEQPSSSSSSSGPPAKGVSLRRKTELTHIVEMIQEYFQQTAGSKVEADELERLASELSLSETPQQVRWHQCCWVWW